MYKTTKSGLTNKKPVENKNNGFWIAAHQPKQKKLPL